MPNIVQVAAEGMAAPLTRRRLLAGLATAGAAGATVALVAPTTPEAPAESVQRHWLAFCAAIERIAPADCRLVIHGLHQQGKETPYVTIRALRTVDEEIRPGRFLPVDRDVGEWRCTAKGLHAEDWS